MIVNSARHDLPSAHAPALHLRRLSAGDLFETYAQSFDTVWEAAKQPSGRTGWARPTTIDDPAAPAGNSLVVAVAWWYSTTTAGSS